MTVTLLEIPPDRFNRWIGDVSVTVRGSKTRNWTFRTQITYRAYGIKEQFCHRSNYLYVFFRRAYRRRNFGRNRKMIQLANSRTESKDLMGELQIRLNELVIICL